MAPTKKQRPDDDFFQTPIGVPRLLLDDLHERDELPYWSTLLDPGAGEGTLAQHVEEWMRGIYDRIPAITAVEQDPDRLSCCSDHWHRIRADFFGWAEREARKGTVFDAIITNPPFGLKKEGSSGRDPTWQLWVEACLPLLAPDGTMMVLGLQSVLASQGRYAWWQEHVPRVIYQMTKRPSFEPPDYKKTDQRDYIWVVWAGPPGTKSGETRFRWLPVPEDKWCDWRNSTQSRGQWETRGFRHVL